MQPFRSLTLFLALFLLAGCTPGQQPLPTGSKPANGDFLSRLDPQDRRLAEDNMQKALETGASNRTLTWRNGSSARGRVTPLRTYRTNAGFYCREFRERYHTPATGEVGRAATACRDRQGVWRIVRPG